MATKRKSSNEEIRQVEGRINIGEIRVGSLVMYSMTRKKRLKISKGL